MVELQMDSCWKIRILGFWINYILDEVTGYSNLYVLISGLYDMTCANPNSLSGAAIIFSLGL